MLNPPCSSTNRPKKVERYTFLDSLPMHPACSLVSKKQDSLHWQCMRAACSLVSKRQDSLHWQRMRAVHVSVVHIRCNLCKTRVAILFGLSGLDSVSPNSTVPAQWLSGNLLWREENRQVSGRCLWVRVVRAFCISTKILKDKSPYVIKIWYALLFSNWW